MASVHAISNNLKQLSNLNITADDHGQLASLSVDRSNKWHYLISNNIQFADKLAYSIKLPMPEQGLLFAWLEKIVISGQCSNLFVEQLSLDEVSLKRLKQLCTDYHVTLVNLFTQQDIQDNVVRGPW